MNNYLDIEEITKIKEKISMYIKEESLKFDDIKERLNNLNTYLDIKESNNIENIQFELINKFKILTKIHYNDFIVLEKNISKYTDASIKANKIFNNIDVGGYNER